MKDFFPLLPSQRHFAVLRGAMDASAGAGCGVYLGPVSYTHLTGPLLTITLGMINAEDFPDRGGPRIITDCSGRAKHHPRSLCPR